MSMKPKDLEMNAAAAAGFLKSLASPARMRMLCLLIEADHSVSELVVKVSLSQSAVSQHLAKLRDEKIVNYRRDGQTLYYYIQNRNVQKIVRLLHDMYCSR